MLEVYNGDNVIDRFITRLNEEYAKIDALLSEIKPMIITDQQKREFERALDCYLCDKPLGSDRVKDHDHITGLYRGPAHKECNLQLKYRGKKQSNADGKPKSRQDKGYMLPCVFHNLRGYDGHLILKAFNKDMTDKEISCIPNNMERYLSFTIGNIRFIDSFQFMSKSLDELSASLPKEDFNHTALHTPADKLPLLLRKGVFPYEYWSSAERNAEPCLPPREAFFSKLSGEHISVKDYQHGQTVWQAFGMCTLGEYHDLYLKTDVLLLCDVFENFRKTCMLNYKLDPAHYFSAPGLSWDAMLRMTRVRLQLMQEREMHDVIDKGIRGGICCISKKHARANNRHIPDEYDASKPSTYITYVDMNNLYGTAMIEPLPLRDFDFMLPQQIEHFQREFLRIPDNSPTGYIVEVDLDYPDHLHDQHNCYPLAPSNETIQAGDVSSYTCSLAERL